MGSIVLASVLTALTAVAAVFDFKTSRIPNLLIWPGMAAGFVLVLVFHQPLIPRLIGMAVVFFAGMFRIAGLGDIKLWMMTILYAGVLPFLYILLLACCCLFLYCALTDWENFIQIFRGFFMKLFTHVYYLSPQKGYPFAVCMFCGCLLYYGGRGIHVLCFS